MFQFSLDRAHGKYMHVQYALNTDIVVTYRMHPSKTPRFVCKM